MAEMSTPIGVTSGTLGAQRSDIVDFNRCGRPYVQLSMPHFSPPVALEEMAECNSTLTHADMRGGTVGEPSSWRANLARKISCVPCFGAQDIFRGLVNHNSRIVYTRNMMQVRQGCAFCSEKSRKSLL